MYNNIIGHNNEKAGFIKLLKSVKVGLTIAERICIEIVGPVITMNVGLRRTQETESALLLQNIIFCKIVSVEI